MLSSHNVSNSNQNNSQNNSNSQQIKTALISVSDKTGLVEFAKFLQSQSIKILSTGGSAELLKKNGVEVVEVSHFTSFPEIMGGRVKTLQPKIHGGILARRDLDMQIMHDYDIEAIDLVVVNLYPFAKTIARDDCTLEMAIENIDIGGPAMIRSAAKNHKWVSVITDINDYQNFIATYKNKTLDESFRYQLALKAFCHTSEYDAVITKYLGSQLDKNQSSHLKPQIHLRYQKVMDLRYGENPHQKAALYQSNTKNPSSLALMKKLQGKELSYNNFVDTDAAYACLAEFDKSDKACVIVKHANPCGVALADNLVDAYQKAYLCDPTSAFGGVLAFNDEVDENLAQAIITQQFAEVIIAPSFSKESLIIFSKKKDLRVIVNPLENYCEKKVIKQINGSLLIQDEDNLLIEAKNFKQVTEQGVNESQLADLVFAFKVAKHVKSNAIVYAKGGQTLGIGAGQMSRVYAAKIAQIKAYDAGLDLTNCVMASDAFFPFKDSITMATESKVSAIIQPGGSIRDNEVIEEANQQKIAMYFSGSRHFRH